MSTFFWLPADYNVKSFNKHAALDLIRFSGAGMSRTDLADRMGLTRAAVSKPQDCILIGGRLETDIKMGKDSGIATGIVLTGVTDEKTLMEYKHTSDQPDFVFQSIAEVENLLLG